jgi:hypothetical protein
MCFQKHFAAAALPGNVTSEIDIANDVRFFKRDDMPIDEDRSSIKMDT